MGQRMWNNVVMFLFHEIYRITFINKFNFISYINRWKNNFHIIHGLEIFKMQLPLKGVSTLNPPKIIMTSIIFLQFFFGNVWTSHLGLLLFVLNIFDELET